MDLFKPYMLHSDLSAMLNELYMPVLTKQFNQAAASEAFHQYASKASGRPWGSFREPVIPEHDVTVGMDLQHEMMSDARVLLLSAYCHKCELVFSNRTALPSEMLMSRLSDPARVLRLLSEAIELAANEIERMCRINVCCTAEQRAAMAEWLVLHAPMSYEVFAGANFPHVILLMLATELGFIGGPEGIEAPAALVAIRERSAAY